MKKLLLIAAAVVVVVVVALLVIPFFVPVETYKPMLAEQVRKATGRELVIAGEIDLSLLPRVTLQVADVTLSNAPGGQAEVMARVKSLELDVGLFSLLFGSELDIDRFVLVEPVIHLEIDKAGRRNWEMKPGEMKPGAATEVPRGDKTAAADRAGETAAAGDSPLADLRLGDVRLVDGTVTYRDAASGRQEEVTEINLSLSLPSLDEPLAADGVLVWRAEKVELGLSTARPRALLAEGRTGVSLEITAKPIAFSYDGEASRGERLAVLGQVKLEIPSIRGLADWTGTPIEFKGSGLQRFSIGGEVGFDGRRAALDDAEIEFDKIRGKGAFAVDIGGTKPAITARLDVETLDLNPYLPPEAEKQAAGAGEEKKKKEQDKKKRAPADWSDDPIDAGPLHLVDAELDLAAKGMRFRDIKIGRSELAVQLKNGDLNAKLARLELYDGTAKGSITLNARGAAPEIGYDISLKGVQAEPLLRDATGFKRLLGTASADLSGRTKGATQRQLVSGLNGEGQVTFLDGAIRGINIAAMARGRSPADLKASFDDATKTDFAELSGSFVIAGGQLTNRDLLLKAPLLRARGEGRVDLPKRRLRYRITPKAVGSLEGQGGGDEAKGVAVPILAQGPWHDLKYRPDVKDIIKQDGEKILIGVTEGDAKEKVEDAAKGLKGLLKGLGD